MLGRLPITCNVHVYQNVTWHSYPEVGKMLMIFDVSTLNKFNIERK